MLFVYAKFAANQTSQSSPREHNFQFAYDLNKRPTIGILETLEICDRGALHKATGPPKSRNS